MKRHEDIVFTSDGDLFIDTVKKDLMDTMNIKDRDVLQRISTRIGPGKGAWKFAPEIGISWEKYLGKRNTQEVGRQVEALIYGALLKDGYFNSYAIKVDCYPVSKHVIGTLIKLDKGSSYSINVSMIWDLRDNLLIYRKV